MSSLEERLVAHYGSADKIPAVIEADDARALGIRGSSSDDPSGKGLAQFARDAYEADAVASVAPPSTFDVTLTVTVHGSRFMAEHVGWVLEQHVGRLSSVADSTLMVAERA